MYVEYQLIKQEELIIFLQNYNKKYRNYWKMDILDQISGVAITKKGKKPSIHLGAYESSSSKSGKSGSIDTMGWIPQINDKNLSQNQLRVPHFELPVALLNKPESHKDFPLTKTGKQNKFMIQAMNSSLGVILSEQNSECSERSIKLRKRDINGNVQNRKRIQVQVQRSVKIKQTEIDKAQNQWKPGQEQQKLGNYHEVNKLKQNMKAICRQKQQITIRLKQAQKKVKDVEKQLSEYKEAWAKDQKRLFQQHQKQLQKQKQKIQKRYMTQLQQIKQSAKFQNQLQKQRLVFQIESLKYVIQKNGELLKKYGQLNQMAGRSDKIMSININEEKLQHEKNNQGILKELEQKKRQLQDRYLDFYKQTKQFSEMRSQQISVLEQKKRRLHQERVQMRRVMEQQKVQMEEKVNAKVRQVQRKQREIQITIFQNSLMKQAIQKEKVQIKKVNERMMSQLMLEKAKVYEEKQRILQLQCEIYEKLNTVNSFNNVIQIQKGNKKKVCQANNNEKIGALSTNQPRQQIRQVAKFGDYVQTVEGNKFVKRKWKQAHLQCNK